MRDTGPYQRLAWTLINNRLQTLEGELLRPLSMLMTGIASKSGMVECPVGHFAPERLRLEGFDVFTACVLCHGSNQVEAL